MKRANGTGTIVKLGGTRRKPWAVKVSYQARPGLFKQRYLGYYRTGTEAQAELERYNRERAAGVSSSLPTMGEIYEAWSVRKYAKAGQASINSYKAAWGHLGKLERKPMVQITSDDLQAVIDRLEADHKSGSTIANVRMLMRELFAYAMERDMVAKDRSAYVKLPSVEAKHEKGAFDDLQMKKLEKAAASGVPWADTVLMLCYTGFRITEFLSLTRFSYDAKSDCLVGGMKTAAGKNRIVPVHPKIKPYLLAWLEKGGDTIICSEDGNAISAWTYRSKLFPPVMAQIGAPDSATPHWTRHTAASRMKAAGMDDLAIRRILGHSDSSITDHYTHLTVEYLREQILKVA